MTTTPDYDVIVVGARCAGSPTAMLLARRGHRVLLVDRATFPSDTLSTLVIHGHGVAALDRWGVLDGVLATGCPTFDTYVFDFGPLVISGSPLPHPSFAIAPRRTVLDKLLVDTAADAGADVREGVTLEDVVVERGAVVGIRAVDASGDRLDVTARIVVGADGWNSFVARRVGAARHHEKPVLEHAFYTYWSGLPFDAFTTFIRGDRGIAAIPTNDGLTLVLVGCPYAQAADFRRDVEASYLAAFEREPELSKRLRSATREERIVGGGVPNFLRTPSGPGWVLVGDASYTRDPITAQGITHAFHSAEWCADALDHVLTGRRGFDDAMQQYRQVRDRAVLPLYELTTQLATLEPPPPELQAYLGSIAGNQAAMDAFVSVMAGTLSPAEGMPAPA
ncbi:MAG TPA: NAD(P)/FAD-dependent oxidoreductase [Acidimicrobiales bacterium]|nr:NAD(P)/FAD-dependent oxidoreductase [Acidimicrobiales bacterium]